MNKPSPVTVDLPPSAQGVYKDSEGVEWAGKFYNGKFFNGRTFIFLR